MKVEIVLCAYNDFSPDMADVAEKFFEDRWIHAPVMPGKRGELSVTPVHLMCTRM